MSTIFQPGRKLADYQREIILAAYKFYGNNKTKTALSLDIAIRTLDARLVEYGLEKEVPSPAPIPEKPKAQAQKHATK